MLSLTARETIRNRKISALLCSEISAPFIENLKIKKPRFHVQHRIGPLNETPSWGETSVISGKPHVFISSSKNQTWSELLATISHELIHCWQFTTQHNCRGEVFNPFLCEVQAYALEPLASIALAASFLSLAQSAKKETKAA